MKGEFEEMGNGNNIKNFINTENLQLLLNDIYKLNIVEQKVLADLIYERLNKVKMETQRQDTLNMAINKNPIINKLNGMLGG